MPQRRHLLQLQPADVVPGEALLKVRVADEAGIGGKASQFQRAPRQLPPPSSMNAGSRAGGACLQNPNHAAALCSETGAAWLQRVTVAGGHDWSVKKTSTAVPATRSPASGGTAPAEAAAKASSSARSESSLCEAARAAVPCEQDKQQPFTDSAHAARTESTHAPVTKRE
jgi:hypothetical protein